MKVMPRFIETHRISPFTFRSADIGVVMDMMIHDIDIVLHLVKARPVRVDAVGVNVLARHEDIANARVTFEGGCVANLRPCSLNGSKVEVRASPNATRSPVQVTSEPVRSSGVPGCVLVGQASYLVGKPPVLGSQLSHRYAGNTVLSGFPRFFRS